jgi:uncharacterized membrane protein YphA (DoxX/SURF4 family)
MAAIWVVNGLLCKVLNLVPRHEEIVKRILGTPYPRTLTTLIGLAEIGVGIWILTGIKPRLSATLQILAVVIMNILEFILVPDLLLWGRLNSIFAFLFIILIYLNEFYLNRQLMQQA